MIFGQLRNINLSKLSTRSVWGSRRVTTSSGLRLRVFLHFLTFTQKKGYGLNLTRQVGLNVIWQCNAVLAADEVIIPAAFL
jgi:hypothetical protein